MIDHLVSLIVEKVYPTPSRQDVEKFRDRVREAHARILAARLTRGNISIQIGAIDDAQLIDAKLGKAPWRHN